MKTPTIFQNIPCTLVTGFLGAGKTTVINQLLTTKPTDQRWALLINEFGRIGIDATLLASAQDHPLEQQKVAIREVSGGCICCTSQLPLQIAISRLLSEHYPQRLLIEPTGLAHPRELVNQLGAPHWQTTLAMQAVITVLSGRQWQQTSYRQQEGFQAHVRDADVLIINRYEQLSDTDQHALKAWIAELNSHVSIIWAPTEPLLPETGHSYLSALSSQLSTTSQIIAKQRKTYISHPHKAAVSVSPRSAPLSPLASPDALIDSESTAEQPYRYHETQQGVLLAGWRLPASCVLHADKLQSWLLTLPNWQRIKGVVHTSDGWLQINFTPDSLSTRTVDTQVDSRLEVILRSDEGLQDTAAAKDNEADHARVSPAIDWDAHDCALMALVI